MQFQYTGVYHSCSSNTQEYTIRAVSIHRGIPFVQFLYTGAYILEIQNTVVCTLVQGFTSAVDMVNGRCYFNLSVPFAIP